MSTQLNGPTNGKVLASRVQQGPRRGFVRAAFFPIQYYWLLTTFHINQVSNPLWHPRASLKATARYLRSPRKSGLAQVLDAEVSVSTPYPISIQRTFTFCVEFPSVTEM